MWRNKLILFSTEFGLTYPCAFFLVLQDRNSFSLKLDDVENWLYEDGEDQQKQVYIDKLAEMKVTTSTGGTIVPTLYLYKSKEACIKKRRAKANPLDKVKVLIIFLYSNKSKKVLVMKCVFLFN